MDLKWYVSAAGGRKGTQRIESQRVVTVQTSEGMKTVTLPKIELIWSPAWIKRDKNNEETRGPDCIDLGNLSPVTVSAFEQHPDWGKDWQKKMVARFESDQMLSPGKPELEVEVKMTASQAKIVREMLAESGTKLPGPDFKTGDEVYSPATQGAVGAGGRAVKKRD